MRLLHGVLAAVLATHGAVGAEVGERRLTAHTASAAMRDAVHRDTLRVTIWYPAAPDSHEAPLDIGPPDKPLFRAGTAAPNAAFVDERRRAVILLSHGFGGTARIMAWFGTALARHGYIVVAVDHPGNNAVDPMTVAGAVLFWERPGDLATALARVEADPVIEPHFDRARLGVAGFSAGGFTALAAAGARVDVDQFRAFCRTHPADGVCRPQPEFAVTMAQADRLLAQPAMAQELDRSSEDLSIPGVKAVFVMAPALIQSVDFASLQDLKLPVSIVLGDADRVAPPATNGEPAAIAIPGAAIKILPQVGHYDFLADCTQAGNAVLPVCPTQVPRMQTHATVTEAATGFFDQAIGGP